MQIFQGLLTNKLLTAILAALVLGFGGVFLHWQQEANEKAEAEKQATDRVIEQNRASLKRTFDQIKANGKRPADDCRGITC
ncbi:MAG TPA: hypothetical protein VIJ25_20840 [Methylococcales bacterium]